MVQIKWKKLNNIIIYGTNLFNVKIKELCNKRPSKSVDTRLINRNTLKYDLKFITICAIINVIFHISIYLSVNYKQKPKDSIHLSQ